VVIGLVLAMSGGILVGLSGDAGDPPTRSDPLLGNGLAVIGAIMVALYFMIGRRLRARLSVMVYIWLVYGTAALVLILTVLVSGQQVAGFRPGLPVDDPARLGLADRAFVAQLRPWILPVAYVGLVTLAEPVGSGVLAVIFLDEWPVLLQLAGSALILLGIGCATHEDRVLSVQAVET
jgi:drug/metabolite transporter (DMT)-like permease